MRRLILLAGLVCLMSVAAETNPFDSGAASTVTLDATRTLGPVRRLNGMNNTVPLMQTDFPEMSLSNAFARLRIPYTRFHDAALENPGYELIDVSRVFPLFDADPDDPKSYVFEPTDAYLAGCRAIGSEIEYRLGESIELSRQRFKVKPPRDNRKWAEVCAHIVRHYNCGWANGFRWNIRRWSVWEEPDNTHLLDRKNAFTFNYLPLYAETARRLKAEFPDILVGGPQSTGPNKRLPEFLRYCRDNQLPLDFCGWSHYSRSPEGIMEAVRKIRGLLDEHGFAKTTVQLAEWHMMPESWEFCRKPGKFAAGAADLTSVHGAAFDVAVLALGQDEPLDRAYYYSASSGCFGLFKPGSGLPQPGYYAFQAFADVAEGEVRLSTAAPAKSGLYALASRRADGRVLVLVSAYRASCGDVTVRMEGLKPVALSTLEENRPFERTPVSSAPSAPFVLRHRTGESSVWMIEAR